MSGLPFRRIADRLNLAALDPWWRQSRGWWSERSLREQLLLGVLASLAILALLLIGVVRPLQSWREDAFSDLHNAALIEARLRSSGGDPARPTQMRRGTASAILTNSAAAAHLSIQRIEPEGGNTRVVLGDAPFDAVMRWVADIEQSSRLRIQQAQIDRKGAPGIVTATFVISG